MNAIGGYLSLEQTNHKNKIYHEDAIAFNSGRNALKHILKVRNVEQIYLPYYTCQAVLEPIRDLNIDFDFYSIDKNLEIELLDKPGNNSCLLYINYFGLKSQYIDELAEHMDNLIIDNSQAFYDKPFQNTDTFYSPRKFFGVPGGGYAYGENIERAYEYEKDIAYDRCQHLLIRADINAEEGYKIFKENEKNFQNRPIKKMSDLTQKLLSNIPYDEVRKKRRANYSYLHDNLGSINTDFNIADTDYECPLIYPFKNDKISREELIDNKIYIPKYWPNIENNLSDKNCIESDLVNNLIALPIDQRYNREEMDRIITLINEHF